MPRVVILGTGSDERNVWEALALRGTADIAAFVGVEERQHGRPLLGSTIQPPDWLDERRFDLIAVTGACPASLTKRLAQLSIPNDCVVRFPADATPEELSAVAAERFPDPLAWATTERPAPEGLRLGIFGTGSGAMKVWEALAEIDAANAVWFADNNAKQHGQSLLWLDIIAPAAIVSRSYDAIVIGSMSVDPIRRQLIELGIPGRRLLAPNVTGTVAAVREELVIALEALQEVVPR